MALSQILKLECPQCGKIAVEKSRIVFDDSKLVTLECGHVITEQTLAKGKIKITNMNGKFELMPFQYDGIAFAETADAKCLIADEQGLGKTLEVLGLLKTHAAELLPAVIVVPSSVKLQWHHQIIDWCGVNGFLTQTIRSGKEKAAPGFQIYIVTYDLLKNDDAFELLRGNVKTLVIDECQKIKNHLSDRAKAVQRIANGVPHIIALSGTPIENNAGEFFTVLNLLKPRRFPHYQRYLDDFCDSYWNGYGNKVGGLKNKDYFHEETKDIIIRRRKADVLKDLPKFTRQFFHAELDKQFNKAYANGLKELEDVLYDDEISSQERGSATIAIMSRLRHLTGLSKIDQCVDYATEFILSGSRKLVIFTHHLDVAELLKKKLDGYLQAGGMPETLHFHSGLSSDARDELTQKFIKGDNRILIASTLAAGIGLDGLQRVCDTFIMLERQWNPSKENQAEARLDRFGQTMPVTGVYMIASETIDEYFTELVEQKRAIVKQAVDNEDIQWDESSLMTELANILVTKGKEKWHL